MGKRAQYVKPSCHSWPVEATLSSKRHMEVQWAWPVEPRQGRENRTCTTVTARHSTGRFRRIRFCRSPGFAECFGICPASSRRTTCRCLSERVRNFHREVFEPVGQTWKKSVPENKKCMMPPQHFRQNIENQASAIPSGVFTQPHRLFP